MRLSRKKLCLALLFAGCICSPLSWCQEKDDYARFAKDGGEDIPLYRGKLAMGYNLLYNGTYTWDLDGFMKGDVVYCGKTYEGVLLGINAHQQELLLKYSPESVFVITLGNKDVQEFTRGSGHWMNLHDYGVPSAPEGFLEVIYQGRESFFRRVDKTFKQNVNASPDVFGPMDKEIDSRTTSFFEHKVTYWVLKDGVAYRVKNAKALLSLHKDQKKALKSHMKESRIPTDDFPRWGAEALKFLEYGR